MKLIKQGVDLLYNRPIKTPQEYSGLKKKRGVEERGKKILMPTNKLRLAMKQKKLLKN